MHMMISQQWKYDKLLKQCENKFAREQQQELIESRINTRTSLVVSETIVTK